MAKGVAHDVADDLAHPHRIDQYLGQALIGGSPDLNAGIGRRINRLHEADRRSHLLAEQGTQVGISVEIETRHRGKDAALDRPELFALKVLGQTSRSGRDERRVKRVRYA